MDLINNIILGNQRSDTGNLLNIIISGNQGSDNKKISGNQGSEEGISRRDLKRGFQRGDFRKGFQGTRDLKERTEKL